MTTGNAARGACDVGNRMLKSGGAEGDVLRLKRVEFAQNGARNMHEARQRLEILQILSGHLNLPGAIKLLNPAHTLLPFVPRSLPDENVFAIRMYNSMHVKACHLDPQLTIDLLSFVRTRESCNDPSRNVFGGDLDRLVVSGRLPVSVLESQNRQ